MLSRYFRIAASAALLLGIVASGASAAVLWDQSNWNQVNEGSLNLASTSCSQISGNTKVHIANDVHFSSPVTITTVRIYETAGNVQAATQAYLWIAPKTGPNSITRWCPSRSESTPKTGDRSSSDTKNAEASNARVDAWTT